MTSPTQPASSYWRHLQPVLPCAWWVCFRLDATNQSQAADTPLAVTSSEFVKPGQNSGSVTSDSVSFVLRRAISDRQAGWSCAPCEPNRLCKFWTIPVPTFVVKVPLPKM